MNSAHSSHCYQRPAWTSWYPVKHRQNAFLTSLLQYGTDGMSSHQLAQYITLRLLLGLPLPSLPTPDGICMYQAPYSAFGYHQLNCSKWVGLSWKKGHDFVVKALTFEMTAWNGCTGFRLYHEDWQCSSNFTNTGAYCCYIWCVDQHPLSIFIIDVKVCAMFIEDGDWKARWNPDKAVPENHTLTQDHCIFFLYHFHIFLYTPLTLNPKP